MQRVGFNQSTIHLDAVRGAQLHTVRYGQGELHRFQDIPGIQRGGRLVELRTKRGDIAVFHLFKVIASLDEITAVSLQRTLQAIDLRIGLFSAVGTHLHRVQERINILEDTALVIKP